MGTAFFLSKEPADVTPAPSKAWGKTKGAKARKLVRMTEEERDVHRS